jgi:hypothetical protein
MPLVGFVIWPVMRLTVMLTPDKPYFSCWRMRAVATRSLPPERSARRRKKITTRLRSFTLSFGPENVPMLLKP